MLAADCFDFSLPSDMPAQLKALVRLLTVSDPALRLSAAEALAWVPWLSSNEVAIEEDVTDYLSRRFSERPSEQALEAAAKEHDAIKKQQEEEVQAFMKAIGAQLAEQHEERCAEYNGTILHREAAMRAVLEERRLEANAANASPAVATPAPSATGTVPEPSGACAAPVDTSATTCIEPATLSQQQLGVAQLASAGPELPPPRQGDAGVFSPVVACTPVVGSHLQQVVLSCNWSVSQPKACRLAVGDGLVMLCAIHPPACSRVFILSSPTSHLLSSQLTRGHESQP
jgi:hypothetical protein